MKREPRIDKADMVRSDTLSASICWAVSFAMLWREEFDEVGRWSTILLARRRLGKALGC